MTLSKETAIRLLEAAAVFGTGIAAGFTFYISKIEIPSRKNDTGAFCVAHYQHVVPPSTTFMKSYFGIVLNGMMGGVIYTTRKPVWWIPLISIGAMSPFTKFVMDEVNTTLMGMKTFQLKTPDEDKEAKKLVKQWGNLHHVRTFMALLGFASAVTAAMDLV